MRGFKKPHGAWVFSFAALATKFWKRDISSTLEGAFSGFLKDFFGCWTPSKKFTRIHSLLVNGIVTASSHALWRVLSIKVIWVLYHCWVDIPHMHIFEGDSVLSNLFAPRWYDSLSPAKAAVIHESQEKIRAHRASSKATRLFLTK